MSDLLHYGTKRHSGRYPWGSGKNPQRNKGIATRVEELRKSGLTDDEIAKSLGTTKEGLNSKIALEKNEYEKEIYDRAARLKKKGYSDEKISEMTGLSKEAIIFANNNQTAEYTGVKPGVNPRQTGRYDWNDPKNPNRNQNLLDKVKDLTARGLSKSQMAKELGFSSGAELTANISIATNAVKKANIEAVNAMLKEGITNKSEMARRLNVSEGTIRNIIKGTNLDRRDANTQLADRLKNIVKEKGYIDVGVGTERILDVSRDQMKVAMEILKKEGYNTLNITVDQLGTKPGQKTRIMVLSPPDVTAKEAYSEIYNDLTKIKSVEDFSTGVEISKRGLPPINSISSDRIQINYKETGGAEKDGTIEIRRGLDDLNLGSAKYAQVRIAVDDKLYLKGMAVYADDLPPGVDVRFNTKKETGTPKEDVFKKLKDDPNNPFGATIKPERTLQRVPRYYTDENGNQKVSPINVVYEEGDWGEWSRTIASQMLSKQPNELVKRQLKLSYDIKRSELDSILQLDNPVVKKNLLDGYASDCDATAVHLKATAFPHQQTKVLLPVPTLKDNEIYAPGYKLGEMVALIRYPHGGRFEIPILKVTKNNKEASSMMKNAEDAVGINSHNLAMLSGADTDGDSVIVIPTGKSVRIMNDTIHSIGAFDTDSYKIDRNDPAQKNIKRLEGKAKQNEMGRITNLITDMTVQNAPFEEIARAVKHSMVVIDAEKHDLDYRKSERDNNIAELRAKYQVQPDGSIGGAATIFSRAKSKDTVYTRKLVNDKEHGIVNGIDKKTGELVYETLPNDTYPVYEKVKYTDPLNTTKSGTPKTKTLDSSKVTGIKSMANKLRNDPDKINKIADKFEIPKEAVEIALNAKVKEIKHRTIDSTKMAETKDAFTLVSTANTSNERSYATYANQLKSLANEARKEMVNTALPKADPEAKKRYAKEVASLDYQLNQALLNAPRERQAQAIGNQWLNEKKRDAEANGVTIDSDQMKKLRNQYLTAARDTVGAHKQRVDITEKEWEAIQARAISPSKLTQILNNADMDAVKKLATPRKNKGLTSSQVALIKSMAKTSSNGGFTQGEIAEKLGISPSAVSNVLNSM